MLQRVCAARSSRHVVRKRLSRPRRYITISAPPSLEAPKMRSTNTMGTCGCVVVVWCSQECSVECVGVGVWGGGQVSG